MKNVNIVLNKKHDIKQEIENYRLASLNANCEQIFEWLVYYSQTPIDNMVESTSTLSQFTLEGKKTREVIYGKYLHCVNLKIWNFPRSLSFWLFLYYINDLPENNFYKLFYYLTACIPKVYAEYSSLFCVAKHPNLFWVAKHPKHFNGKWVLALVNKFLKFLSTASIINQFTVLCFSIAPWKNLHRGTKDCF